MENTALKFYNNSIDALRWYFKQLKTVELLSEKEELKLVKILEDSKDKNIIENARKKMLESNLKLVINIAKNYQNRGLPLIDLIQEGNIGLMTALDKFKCEKGNKFSTYATWWIKQKISRAIINQADSIRIPVNLLPLINKNKEIEKEIIEAGGDVDLKFSEIAKKLKISESRLYAIKHLSQKTISLQTPVCAEGLTITLEDVLKDKKKSNDPVKHIASEMILEAIHNALGTLPEREREIIKMRFGLGDYTKLTLVELSKKFNLTKEGIRQIEKNAIEKLKGKDSIKFFDKV